MFIPKFTITSRTAAALAAIERARGFLEAAQFSAQWVTQRQDSALVQEAYYTTHIEGTQLTLSQSEQLWKGNAVMGADSEDVKELLNFREAFNLVSHYIGSGEFITEGVIREIHKYLVKNIRGNSASPGDYRKIQNYVVNSQTKEVIYTPPPVYEIAMLMQELIDWLNEEVSVHPVLIAGIEQFQLVHVHPFLDGNGRTARLLSTLCLYRSGYDFKKLFTLSEYYDKNRTMYYQAIQNVRHNHMDMTEWLEYFTQGLSTQLQEIKIVGQQAMAQNLFETQYDLSARQKIAVEYMAKHGSFSIQIFEKICPDVTRRTLQCELSDLIQKNIIESSGATTKLIYKLRVLL